jgi:hypothetical protein
LFAVNAESEMSHFLLLIFAIIFGSSFFSLILITDYFSSNHVNAFAQKANSSSIKEIIDKMVSDTLGGMMNNTIANLMKNAPSAALINHSSSPQNKFPSSIDISHVPSSLPYDQQASMNPSLTSTQKTGANSNNEINGRLADNPKRTTINDFKIQQINLTNMKTGKEINENSSSSNLIKDQPTNNTQQSNNFFNEIMHKLRQLFFHSIN